MTKTQSLFDGPGRRLFSIDAGSPFLVRLADCVIDSLDADPVRIAGARIFLPTRRAAREALSAFSEAFVRRGADATLTPRLVALGEVDEDAMLPSGAIEEDASLPPAIGAMERRFVFARMIAAAERGFFDGQQNWPAAWAAAGELADLVDSFHAEEASLADLAAVDVGPYAKHWGRSLDFLKIALEQWPAYLAAAGRLDAADRRARLISAEAAILAAAPPQGPVILAGSTASAPAVQRLAAAILKAPMGAVILPGLDRDLDFAARAQMDDAHPQAGLLALLSSLGALPADVRRIGSDGATARRAAMLSVAMRPAAATDDWPMLVSGLRDSGAALAADGLQFVEAETEDAEAEAIAMILRGALARNETAMLATPDRTLARRVSMKLRRWGAIAEDSAGEPLSETRCGMFLRLVAEMLEHPGDAARLIAVLRHPLAQFGLETEARRRAVDAIDGALRCPVGIGGFPAIAARLAKSQDAQPLAERLAAIHAPAPADSLEKAAAALIDAAEAIAAPAGDDGDQSLWRGADGEAAARLLADIAELPPARMDGLAFADFLADAAAAVAVRRNAPGAGIRILGPLEARLLSADQLVLGGLNEGVWPAEPAGDPFLSRPMRRALGLFSPERRIGLSAHDFIGLCAQPRVTLTRARRVDGQPSKPSRWLVRIKNILGEAMCGAIDQTALYAAWSDERAKAARTSPTEAPRPRPGARPTALPVTAIETWVRDPYAIYASRILRLRRLDDPGRAFNAADMGSALHAAFERGARASAPLSLDAMRAIFAEEAGARGLSPAERALWAPAVDEALAWHVNFDADWRARGAATFVEIDGEADYAAAAPFRLTARADRIDVIGGEASIVDFKTSGVPSKSQAGAFNPQLQLIGWIVEQGGFATIGACRAARFAYERILARKDDDKRTTVATEGAEAPAAIAEASRKLGELLAFYDRKDAAYLSQPRPEFKSRYGDYDQLARRREWSLGEEDA
jgi:ATP-dependent helicase/nuclease subunit B